MWNHVLTPLLLSRIIDGQIGGDVGEMISQSNETDLRKIRKTNEPIHHYLRVSMILLLVMQLRNVRNEEGLRNVADRENGFCSPIETRFLHRYNSLLIRTTYHTA